MTDWKSISQQAAVLAGLALAVNTAVAQRSLEDADCIIEPHSSVDLSTSVDGIVDEILVDRGDEIVEGQLLVRLESGLEAAAVRLAKARASETSMIETAAKRLEFAIRKQNRTNTLYADNAISEFAKDEVDLEVEMAGLELRQAEESRERAVLELERAQRMLDMRTIRSPFDGVVVERIASKGEAIGEQQTVLMKLVQIDPLNVELIVPSSEFGSFSAGDVLEVETIGPVEGTYDAEIVTIDPIIDSSSETFGVRALLPNPGNRIPAGLSCRAVAGVQSEQQAAVQTAY